MTAPARIRSIYRYPVKGLSAEPLASAQLQPSRTIAADRLYAIENGPCGFDPAAPAYFPKQRFLMLMRNERLARLATRLRRGDPCPDHSRRRRGGRQRRPAHRRRTGCDRGVLCRLLRRRTAPARRKSCTRTATAFPTSPPRSCRSSTSPPWRRSRTWSSAPVDPLRFRANIYVDGWSAWDEFDLVGREIAIGSARAKVVKRIVRCAATNVEPGTGIRDLAIPKTLLQRFGHADCGIYAEVDRRRRRQRSATPSSSTGREACRFWSIGAGVVGLGVARAAALAGHDVIVAEAADAIGTGTSSRNSEVIHAGLYYPPGSIRAALCAARPPPALCIL